MALDVHGMARRRGRVVASVYGCLIVGTVAFGLTFKVLTELIIRWLSRPPQ